MPSLFFMEWTIVCSETPSIKRPCGRCGSIECYASTGKFRLNANGSLLDAWLIYRCCACNKSWNRTLFERRPVKSLSPEELEGLQRNDPQLAEYFARETEGTIGGQSNLAPQFTLKLKVTGVREALEDKLVLVIRNPAGARVRLDQVLARGLRVSRQTVFRLLDEGRLQLPGDCRKSMRRPVSRETVIELRPKSETCVPRILLLGR